MLSNWLLEKNSPESYLFIVLPKKKKRKCSSVWPNQQKCKRARKISNSNRRSYHNYPWTWSFFVIMNLYHFIPTGSRGAVIKQQSLNVYLNGKRSLLRKSERRKATKKNIENQCLFSSSLLRKSERQKKNEKNIKNLNFVWFSHFNYLWRHFNYLWHMVLWTTGIKKWIFKNSLAWLKLT